MNRPSSRFPGGLPEPAQLERLCQALATLDVLLCPTWEGRCYFFNQGWDRAKGQRMASMHTGTGDEWYLLFQNDGGAFLKGFAHELASPGGPPKGMYDGLPASLLECLGEPAFMIDEVTFSLWNAGAGWQRGTTVIPPGHDPDGSVEMLAVLSGDPADYLDFASAYYEREIPRDAVRRIYGHEPLTPSLASELAPDLELEELEKDLSEIGYPIG